MANERDAQLAVGSQTGRMGLSAQWRNCGMPDQAPKLRCPPAQSPIVQRCLDHRCWIIMPDHHGLIIVRRSLCGDHGAADHCVADHPDSD